MHEVAESEIEDDQDEDTGKYTFAELSDKAKARARDEHRYCEVDHGDWWDCIYEDAVRMAALIGIEIGVMEVRHPNNHLSREPEIYFQGFCSQGDGASWGGRYRYKSDALKTVKTECRDDDLIEIAEQLTVLQVRTQLTRGDTLCATVTTSGNYSHSGTMNVDVTYTNEEDGVSPKEDEDKELTDLLRRFADWIYKSLEAEHDYLTSDEYIDERLADETFDADGDII